MSPLGLKNVQPQCSNSHPVLHESHPHERKRRDSHGVGSARHPLKDPVDIDKYVKGANVVDNEKI